MANKSELKAKYKQLVQQGKDAEADALLKQIQGNKGMTASSSPGVAPVKKSKKK